MARKKQPKTMQAAAIDHFGGADTIHVETLEIPKPQPDEVLIHVESAGVAEWDPFEREGGFAKMFGMTPQFPYVLGSDGAGTVAAIGKQVKGFKKGDRVYLDGRLHSATVQTQSGPKRQVTCIVAANLIMLGHSAKHKEDAGNDSVVVEEIDVTRVDEE